MLRSSILLLIAAGTLFTVRPQNTNNPFLGRWDATVTVGTDRFPSWIEVSEKGGNLDAWVQQRTGNVAPVAAVSLEGKRLIVTIAPAAPARPASENRPASPARPGVVWELTEEGGRLSGSQKMGDTAWPITAVRAPALKRAIPKAWSDPQPLFNGKDLTGWEPVNNTPESIRDHFTSHWAAVNGELLNEARGSNLRSTRTFDDFKLHVEFNCPPDENSGVYLRGRYEVQVGPPPRPSQQPAAGRKKGPDSGGYRNPFGCVGCVYGRLGPSTPPPFRPDWQTYDITLVGRWVTIVVNGVTTIDNQEIAGPTGGALDANEAEPGPIYFQGDHHGGIRYRNITVSVPKR